MSPCCVLIPAYKPGAELPELVRALDERDEVVAVVVVDDGSGPEYAGVFEEALGASSKLTLLRHAINLGKGAALKTGLNQALCDFGSEGVTVTADADGQHLPEDILAVGRDGAAHAGSLVLGTRVFGGEVPLRSRVGNLLTRYVMLAAVGCRLEDTQTGLRAIPARLAAKMLKVRSTGYEFELDMLVICKQAGIPIRQVPIRTVYLDGNASSHFNPVLDSMRIYFVLLRFAMTSVLTACIDYIVFATMMTLDAPLPVAQASARAVAMVFQYVAVKRLVFYSDQQHAVVFPRYLLVVVLSGLVSYGLIRLFVDAAGINVLAAKPIAETLVFFANFAVLREFIFVRRTGGAGENHD